MIHTWLTQSSVYHKLHWLVKKMHYALVPPGAGKSAPRGTQLWAWLRFPNGLKRWITSDVSSYVLVPCLGALNFPKAQALACFQPVFQDHQLPLPGSALAQNWSVHKTSKWSLKQNMIVQLYNSYKQRIPGGYLLKQCQTGSIIRCLALRLDKHLSKATNIFKHLVFGRKSRTKTLGCPNISQPFPRLA